MISSQVESKVRLWLIALILLMVFVAAFSAFQYIKEVEKQTYFTNLKGDLDNDYADIKYEKTHAQD